MREVAIPQGSISEAASFAACVATILELSLDDVPKAPPGEAVVGWRTLRWLGGLRLGLVAVADAPNFSWAGPWIGWVRVDGDQRRAVVMFGVPSGVVFDPARVTDGAGWELVAGHVIAPLDVAEALPPALDAPTTVGKVESIWIAPSAGSEALSLGEVHAIAGLGLEGDRHVSGQGTFPSRMPGSALTLIEAEVCESFSPPLSAAEHRRNLVIRGIDLNRLVGREFFVGSTPCRGMRLNEPCSVLQHYASRPILRALVHRGGLRADILENGTIRVGDEVRLHPRTTT